MNAEDLMTERPLATRPYATIRQAIALLHEMDLGQLPVVDDDGALVGMLSERDLRGVAWLADDGADRAERVARALGTPVSTILSPRVLSVDCAADVAEVVDLMLDNRVGAIAVVDQDAKLVGIVSYADVLRELLPGA